MNSTKFPRSPLGALAPLDLGSPPANRTLLYWFVGPGPSTRWQAGYGAAPWCRSTF
jgi:hypothetical protein